MEDTHIIFEITDHGVGIDHLRPDVSPGMGMGLTLMHQLADTTITSPNSQGTRVELRFPR